MERKLNAELWDKMHYLFRDYNDRMVHVELRYDFEIDINALKTVLVCFLEKAPVLHSSFTDNRIAPYWIVKNYKIDDVLTVKTVSEDLLEEEINSFLVQYIPPDADLQIKVAVFNHSGKSVLCVVENHMRQAKNTAQPLMICCLRHTFMPCMSLRDLTAAKVYPFPAQWI